MQNLPHLTAGQVNWMAGCVRSASSKVESHYGDEQGTKFVSGLFVVGQESFCAR